MEKFESIFDKSVLINTRDYSKNDPNNISNNVKLAKLRIDKKRYGL